MLGYAASAPSKVRLPSSGGVSEDIQRQLVEMLFAQRATLLAGGFAMALAELICWLRTGQRWLIVAAIATLGALAVRLAIEWAFHHRSDRRTGILAWHLRFVAGAWLAGIMWGAVALSIVTRSDPFVQMFLISLETSTIMGGAARNASSPLAAIGQSVLGLAPLFVACIATLDRYYLAFSVYIVFAFLGALVLVRSLYSHHVRFLITNEEKVNLVGEIRRANLELGAADELLETAATTDSLTGIANRRRFDAVLAHGVSRAARERSELALLIIDFDSFKGYNDLYGHQAGDAALQRVAQALWTNLRRKSDLVARYGGEEFAAVLPQTDAGSALALAEGVRGAVEALALLNAAGPAGVLSVSIRVASFDPGRFRGPEDFLRGADEALYAAKAAGRNCVRLFADADADDGGRSVAAGGCEAGAAAGA